MIRIIAIALMCLLISCGGDSITKAGDITEVFNAHFQYKDIEQSVEGAEKQTGWGGDYWSAGVLVTGKVKNNSGINIRNAKFAVSGYTEKRKFISNDKYDKAGVFVEFVTIKDFIDGETRGFIVIVGFSADAKVYTRGDLDELMNSIKIEITYQHDDD